jgi:hypothetical protein
VEDEQHKDENEAIKKGTSWGWIGAGLRINQLFHEMPLFLGDTKHLAERIGSQKKCDRKTSECPNSKLFVFFVCQ